MKSTGDLEFEILPSRLARSEVTEFAQPSSVGKRCLGRIKKVLSRETYVLGS